MAHRPVRGYSLIELLVVLAIVAILAIAGVTMIGNRPAGAVRAVMDEVEGTLYAAHKRCVARGRDVDIVTRGEWDPAQPALIAFGDTPVPADNGAGILAAGANASESFRMALNAAGGPAREHLYAGIVPAGSTWWATVQAASQDITKVVPFSTTASFKGLLDDKNNNLFQGGANVNVVTISGANKRFTEPCFVQVVALRNGNIPVAGGPMGLLVVLANGATVYKFYNPGTIDGGDGQWRKL